MHTHTHTHTHTYFYIHHENIHYLKFLVHYLYSHYVNKKCFRLGILFALGLGEEVSRVEDDTHSLANGLCSPISQACV